ncbi:hypothetical protein BGW41_006838 [Actinomortierella wolfii]|nr:hypothetical protein BGW41_006838 [Actinomortierella wolfii]
MAEHPSAPAPISAPTATNGSTPNAKPRSTIPSSSVPTQPAGAATSTAASAAPPTSTSSSTVAAVLTADDIKYKRKYRDLKKRIREIEEENDQLNLKLTRARKNIRRLRVERSFLFEKLDNVDLPTTNHSLDNASSASSSSGSEDASEDPARRTSVKKKGIQQPPISADSSAAISSRKPKGRPPGRKSTGPSPRRRGATQEKEQHSKNEKEQPLQQQGHDEEEDQLDEEEYETQAAKDTLSLNGNTSMNNDATQDNAMSIDQVTSHSDIDGSHEPAVKEEAMNVDPKELQVDEVMDDTTLPAQTSAQRPQEELNEGQENPRMQALGEPQSVASVARSSIEYKQGQSQSQGESQLSSGQESTTPVQAAS